MTQPYFPGQYPQQAYQQPSAYQGLSKRQKRSAAWAGALGLNLMSFGTSVLATAVVLGILAAAFAGISSSAGQGSGLQGFDEFLAESGASIWLVVAAVVGAAVLLIGMFVSATILRTGGIRRPYAVTWSAFGVTLPLLAFLGFLSAILAQVVIVTSSVGAATSAAQGNPPGGSPATFGIIVVIVAYLLSIVAIGIAGWLAWWWMAHVFRERIPVAPGSANARGGRDRAGDGGYPVVFGGAGGGGGGGD